jgi:hypothetical protein
MEQPSTPPARGRRFLLLLLLGLLVRAVALPLHGTGDVHVWKTWSFGATNGILDMYGVGGDPPVRGVVEWGEVRTTVDYPPGTLAGLSAIGHAYRWIDPEYRDTRALTVFIKLSILLMDILACALVYRLGTGLAGASAGRMAALLFWLNPAVILDGAVLGYLDPWVAVPVLAALAAGAGGFGAWTGAMLAVGALVKLQALFAAPAVALLLWHRTNRPVTASRAAAVAFGVVSAIALVPFALHGALPNVAQGVGALLRQDMLSGYAANLWWIVTWGLRVWYAIPDIGAWDAWTMETRILGVRRFMELGYPNPRPIGLALTTAAACWGFYRAHLAARHGRGQVSLLAAGAFAIHAYFLLAVQVHENHLYLALPLLAVVAAVDRRHRAVTSAISAVVVLNLSLFYGLGGDIPPPARTFTLVDATVLLSFAHLGVFAWHARVLSRMMPPTFMPLSSRG